MFAGEKKPGLRERQRLAVLKEMREAAFRLFEERGFEEVSVAEIAALAGVSERTFFRYFATKEDVVLTVLEGFGVDIISRLESVPLDRSWFEILRDTYVEVASTEVTMEGERSAYLQQSAARVLRLVQASPRLRAGLDAKYREWSDDIAQIIARRSGFDIDRDPRPRIWATVAIATISINAVRQAAVQAPSGKHIREAFDALEGFLNKASAGDSPIRHE